MLYSRNRTFGTASRVIGDLPLMELPSMPRRVSQEPTWERASRKLALELRQSLRNLARSHQQPLSNLLLTALAMLLHRYTGQDDIVVGSSADNIAQLEAAHFDFVDNPSFKQLLLRVEYQQITASQGKVQVLFDHVGARPFDGLFDLRFMPIDDSEHLTIRLDYDKNLFHSETMERLLANFETLLNGIVVDPEQPLSGLPLLAPSELQRQLVEWNDTAADYPRDQCIHELFEAQAAGNPDAIAVVFEEEQLSYSALNTRANQLAHYLQGRGVGPNVLVALCMERSLELIIGILGILKAGGAYVPLDPTYPKERLAFMLSDCAAPVLVTQTRLLAALPDVSGSVVCLDRERDLIDEQPQDKLCSAGGAQSLAYVIYTSGSTGRPKGVMIAHQGLCNVALFQQRTLKANTGSRVLQFASPSFDASVFEWTLALCAGATLYLANVALSLPGPALSEFLRRSRITHLFLTPSALAALPADPLPDLEMITVGGEASSAELVSRWATGRRFFNLYGPTEATILATSARCSAADNPPPIGRPISNTDVYILDEYENPVPVGIAGEIYIGGDGLATGYLNRPELTAEKFVPHPFSNDPQARLYRTGDLARFRADGNIEFLGRIDQQVKIRGFRIELGEIEAVLAEHPAVAQAVVDAREASPGGKRLVAYVVRNDKGASSIDALRRHLQGRLPGYMVPSAMVFLDDLPLNPNGKVDRAALPEPGRERPELEEPFIAPCTPLEETIAGLWREVLGIEQVGIRDNFFELGGDSLRVTQMLAGVREQFALEIPQLDFYRDATLSSLVSTIGSTSTGEALPDPELALEKRTAGERDFPLSFAQERAWFLHQLESTSRLAYQTQCTLRFRGKLNVEALGAALTEVVRRHEILRTTFPTVEGSPVQRIHSPQPVELPVHDLTLLPREERESAAQEEIAALIRQLIDINKAPLARWTLLRLDVNDHILVQVEHHLVHDGWSLTVLLRELFELYKSFSRNEPPPLPEPQWQFVDFARWQRRHAEESKVQSQSGFWKSKLAGAPNLDIPTDFSRPPQQQYRGAAPRFDLDRRLDRAVETLSRQERASRFMTMLAAFSLLLSRYCNQDDVCVGTGIANRRWKFTEGLIGMLLNNIVLRINLTGKLTFRELLQRVRNTTIEAYANQDAPFDKIVEAVQPQRDPSRNPLFQVMFSFHDSAMPDVVVPDLNIELIEGHSNGSAKFDMNIVVIPPATSGLAKFRNTTGNGTIIWEYNTALFAPSTIAQMTQQYLSLLEAAVAEPDTPLAMLRWPAEAERRRLLVEWNMTQRDYPRDGCIHESYEQQAELRGPATALVFAGQTLSYAELNTRANRLAHFLRSRGVGPDSLVGLCMERSFDLVVGILGILKAGGAYVPLDAAYPPQRLSFMMKDAAVRLLLTQTALLDRLPAFAGEVVCPDRDQTAINRESAENPVINTHGGNLAYVMYTSGSTGEPKGTCIEHRNVLRLVQNPNYLRMGPEEVYLQLAPVSFDAATLELWGSLLNGARLVVPPAQAPSLEELAAVIVQERISTLWLTAALFHEMVEHQLDALLQVRQLLAGGDVLSLPHVRRVLAQLKDGHQLINGYGPTESTTFTCCHVMDNASKVGRSVPIGRPISNTTVYILDQYENPVPVGVAGELYVGGDGLARGYLNRPALTAEKFVHHPFSDDPQARLYRTGDLARYLPDGNIEFLGRMDHQVKIRGFRIELGEVEAALAEHPGVAQVVVVAREETPGTKRLVAYIVGNDQVTASVESLRTHLQARLPAYMVPSAFLYLDALPLTPNGKVDRAALPEPGGERPELEETFIAPRTPAEEAIAGLWREILGVEQIGIHDNFFELGGHSLMVTQLIVRLRKALKVDLPVRAVFDSPTVASLAVAVSSTTSSDQARNTSVIRALPREKTANQRPRKPDK